MPLRPDSDLSDFKLMPRILNHQSFLVHLRGQTQLLPMIHQANNPIGVVRVFVVQFVAPCHISHRDPVAINPVALPPNVCGLPRSPFIRTD